MSSDESSSVNESHPRKRVTRSEKTLANKRLGDLMLENSDPEPESSGSLGKESSVKSRRDATKVRPSTIRVPGERKSGRNLNTHSYQDVEMDTDELATESEAYFKKSSVASRQTRKREKVDSQLKIVPDR